MLVPLEIVQAPSVSEMSKEGFVDGWKAAGYGNSFFKIVIVLTLLQGRDNSKTEVICGWPDKAIII